MAADRRTILLRWIPAMALLFPFLYLAFDLLASGVPDLTNGADAALLEMSTRDVFSRRILLGPYSRFLFYHPGPLYFIVRYPVYMLMGQRSSSCLVSTILIAAGSMLFIWRTARKKAGEVSGAITAVLFILFLASVGRSIWLSEWNPHVIMFPTLLFAVSSAVFASGDSRYLIACAVAGSFVAQTHLGGIPFLVALFAVSVLLLAYPWLIRRTALKSPSPRWKHVLWGAAILLLLWAPPLYEQFSSEKGNMTRIREYFEETTPEITAVQGLEHWSRAVTRFELVRFLPSLRRSGNHDEAALFIIALRVLLLSVSYGLLRRKGISPFLCALNILMVAAHAASLYSVTQIRGPVNDYLIEWMSGIALLSYMAAVSAFSALLAGRLSVNVRRVFAYLTPVMAMALSAVVTRDVSGYLQEQTNSSCHDLRAIEEMSPSLELLMRQDPDTYYILNLQTLDCWVVMTGLMNRLEKQGLNIVMADNAWFPDTPVPEGHPGRILHIGHLSEHGQISPNLVARYDRIGIVLE